MKDIRTRLTAMVVLVAACANGLGVTWSIATPSAGSSRQKGANVAATGTVSNVGQSGGIFKFGTYASGSFVMEN